MRSNKQMTIKRIAHASIYVVFFFSIFFTALSLSLSTLLSYALSYLFAI